MPIGCFVASSTGSSATSATIRLEFRRFLREDVADESRRSSALDVGSGSGRHSRSLQTDMLPGRPFQVLALDRDPTAVASARQAVPGRGPGAMRCACRSPTVRSTSSSP